MKTLSTGEAMQELRRLRTMSYTDIVVRTWGLLHGTGSLKTNLVLMQSRVGHCGGTDYSDLGWVTNETADALVKSGAIDRRHG